MGSDRQPRGTHDAFHARARHKGANLLVYWLVDNLVGFGQQVLINRLLKSEDDEEPQPPEKGKAASRPKKSLSEPRPTQA